MGLKRALEEVNYPKLLQNDFPDHTDTPWSAKKKSFAKETIFPEKHLKIIKNIIFHYFRIFIKIFENFDHLIVLLYR